MKPTNDEHTRSVGQFARACAVALTAALAAAVTAGAVSVPAQAQGNTEIRRDGDELVGQISIPMNKSETVRLDTSFAEVLVGSSDIADVLPLTDRSIYILGQEPGTTNISILDSDSRVIGVLDLQVTLDIPTIRRRIHEATGNSNIRVEDNDGQLVLSGPVNDSPSVDRAMQIASQYAPGNVINAMDVTTTQQVMLKVRFVEATRGAGRELGIRWEGTGTRGRTQIGAEPYPQQAGFPPFDVRYDSQGNPIVDGFYNPDGTGPIPSGVDSLVGGAQMLLSGSDPVGVVLANLMNSGYNIDVLIKALEDKGHARNLAEPNLVAMSGDTAEFLAGGEFPVPVRGSDGEVTIEYKDFGVGLAFTPTVLRDGQINLKLEPTVSQLDFTNAVQSGGVFVPALTTRRASTTIELRDGQSFAIAGLLQNTQRREIAQLPWIGNIPVIGALFRSTNYQNRETDLVIMVTPHLVEPGAPGDRIATPLDRSLPSNDPELFLTGQMEIPKDYRHYVEEGGAVRGPYGHMLDQEFGPDGVVGKSN